MRCRQEQARIRAEQEKQAKMLKTCLRLVGLASWLTRQARIREKLRQISPCPAGFNWPLFQFI